MKIKINNTTCEIEGHVSKNVERQFAIYVPGYRYSPLFKQKKWDGKARLLTGNKFNTGLLPNVVDVLQKERVEFELEDCRYIDPSKVKPKINDHLRDYQTDAANQALSNELFDSWFPRGVLKLSTGAGKSTIAAHLIDCFSGNVLFLTHRIDLIDQFKNNLKDFKITCGTITSTKVDLKKRVTVASIQTLMSYERSFDPNKLTARYVTDKDQPDQDELELAADKLKEKLEKNSDRKELIEKFLEKIEMVIIDEAHIITSTMNGAGLFNKALSKMPNAFIRLGLTATPNLKDQYSNLITQGQTGPILCDVGSQELIEEGYLSPVKVYVHKIPNVVISSKADWATAYDLGVTTHNARNQKIIDLLGSSPCPTLILVSKVGHGDLLVSAAKGKGFDIPFIHGGSDLKERKRVAAQLNNGQLKYAIASTVWDEGIDIPNIQTIILAGAGKSLIKNLQRIGRGMRPGDNKTELTVHDFRDESHKILKRHSAIRANLWKTQGFEVVYK